MGRDVMVVMTTTRGFDDIFARACVSRDVSRCHGFCHTATRFDTFLSRRTTFASIAPFSLNDRT
jgi:hypothetical protein